MNEDTYPLSVQYVLQFIRSYRQLEQLPLEDGFAQLACLSASSTEAETIRLRQHFRNQWYGKERAFGRFYLNLLHHRQIRLLQQWNITDPANSVYLLDCSRNGIVALMKRPPATARQLHRLTVFFENHGISHQVTQTLTLDVVPQEWDSRFGNAANWGDYLLALPDPTKTIELLLEEISQDEG